MAKARRCCPKCGLENIHVRVRICPECGYEFYAKKGGSPSTPPKKIKIKTSNVPVSNKNEEGEECLSLPRSGKGRKICPQCLVYVGARTKACVCGYQFVFNPQPKDKIKTKKNIDWKTLKEGDRIKVIRGTGPVALSKSGVEECVGHHGIFNIQEIHDDGYLCYGGIKGNSGAAFIYLGEEKKLASGTYLRAHKIEFIE